MTWIEVEKGWARRWAMTAVAICVGVYAFAAYETGILFEPSHMGELFVVLLWPGFPLAILFFFPAHIGSSFVARRLFRRNVPIAAFLMTLALIAAGGFLLEFHDQYGTFADEGVGVAVHKGLKAVLACLFAFTMPAIVVNRIGRKRVED
ncbi:MAG TPA: hypothetical protein VGF77_10655 [Allosphingosinicella sp.]